MNTPYIIQRIVFIFVLGLRTCQAYHFCNPSLVPVSKKEVREFQSHLGNTKTKIIYVVPMITVKTAKTNGTWNPTSSNETEDTLLTNKVLDYTWAVVNKRGKPLLHVNANYWFLSLGTLKPGTVRIKMHFEIRENISGCFIDGIAKRDDNLIKLLVTELSTLSKMSECVNHPLCRTGSFTSNWTSVCHRKWAGNLESGVYTCSNSEESWEEKSDALISLTQIIHLFTFIFLSL